MTGEHSVNADGTVHLCVHVLDLLSRDIYDIDIYSSANFWLPPASTPRERFRVPNDWRFEPTTGPVDPDGWRFLPPGPLVSGGVYCLDIPVRPGQTAPTGIEFVATDDKHTEIKRFMSTLQVADARGAVPKRFSLGDGEVAASGAFTANGPTCGSPRVFEDEFRFSTARNTLTILQPRTRDVVAGNVAWNGTFRIHSETETYTGGINGATAIASYTYTRSGCTAYYTAQFALERAGRAVPACARTTVAAPATARVGPGARVPLRLAVTCAGARVAGWPVDVSLSYAGRKYKAGSFRTLASQRNVVVRLGDTRPAELTVRARPAFGLPAATKRVRLVYG